MTDELIQGRRETNEILPAISHSLIRITPNYADIPLYDHVIPLISNALILTTGNYADIPLSDTIISAISQAVTIINDV